MQKTSKSISTIWTRGCKTEEEKERLEQVLRSSSIVVSRLLQILEEEEEEIDTSSMSLKGFESPSWAYNQAYRMGEKNRIRKLIDLLSFIEPHKRKSRN